MRIILNYCRREWLRVCFLAIVAFIVRVPALQGEPIWDDLYLARDNPFIKSPLLILEAFRHYLFLDSLSVYYRPVQNISYVFDYFFWNTDTWGFHLTNVLLHVASGILLYFLLRQLFASLLLRRASIAVRARALKRFPWISLAALLVALIWVVHPVHSAAIDYISGRADSLAFLLASSGWLLFLRGRRTVWPIARGSLYFLAAFCGLLALCSREIAFVWMCLFVAHLVFIERSAPWRFRIGAIVACVTVIAIYAGLRQLPGPRVTQSSENWAAPVRAALMARALGDYGRLMIFPSNLHMERTVFDPAAVRSDAGWRNEIGVEYLSILGLMIAAAFVFGCAWPGPGRTARIFGASWFIAAYLPISNITQLNATAAEHWLYLPSVGFLIFVAGCIVELPRRHWKFAVTGALCAVTGLSFRSYARSTDWVTPETFYRRTLAAGGTSARVGLNLGQIHAGRGEYKQAEKIFRKVLEIAPDYPIALNNLASVLARQGRDKEAEALFARLEKTSTEMRGEYPRTWVGALNLARMRHNAHNDESALAILEQARKDYPEVWELISFKSEILRQTLGPDAALHLVEDFSRANWWHHRAALALGRLYAQADHVDLADAALQRASWLDVHDTEALRLIVQMRLGQNEFKEALRTQRRSIARQPDQPRQYVLLSDILDKMGRNAEARAALAKASQLRSLVQNQLTAN